MFERFTDRGRRAVVLAQEEARLLNHNYIGTEHLLLGLVHEGQGVAAEALASQGISLEAAQQQVEEIIGRGQRSPSGHIPFTARAKKVLELSAREADALGHHYIGTEHVLLGLLRAGEGVAVQVLVGLGADLNRVRDQVLQGLHGEASNAEALRADAGRQAALPRVPSPGGWVAPANVRPAWNWTPPPAITPRLDRVPLWVRLWYGTPFADRSAHAWMWRHGGWDVVPPGAWSPPSSP